jgi:hypothetical protein
MRELSLQNVTLTSMHCDVRALLLTAVEMNSFPMELPEMERMSAVDIAQTPTDLLGMRRSQQERADDMDDMMKKFVFCVPKAGARTPDLKACKIDHNALAREHHLASMISEPLDSFYLPFRKANARLTSFFPDKKLIQFDAGKLQALAELLRERKRGGHKVLIFTQMSKMLDILEAFLNLNGHTYLRLDGGTGVEKRQRLMDRFNNDDKVFCFILSTRSGGLGINLTGADTVVFYDSDWNPVRILISISVILSSRKCDRFVAYHFLSHIVFPLSHLHRQWMRKHRIEPIALARHVTSIFIG